MNKTDPRVIKTLQHIDDSLLENLSRYNFRKITVEMLCRDAKINRSTFYKYYNDKFELLDSYMDRILNEFDEATSSSGFILASPYTVSSDEYLQHIRRILDFIYERRKVYQILWKATIGRRIYQEMEDILCESIFRNSQAASPDSDGEKVSPYPYSELYSRLYASNCMTLVRWWLKHESVVSRSDVEAVMEGNIQKGLHAAFS